MLINQVEEILSQFICVSNHHRVHFKHLTMYTLNILPFYLPIIPQKNWEEKGTIFSGHCAKRHENYK